MGLFSWVVIRAGQTGEEFRDVVPGLDAFQDRRADDSGFGHGCPPPFQGGKIMSFSTLIFAYLGPETVLPMTSALAGAAGVVMLFGRSSLRWASGAVKGLVSRARPRSKPNTRSRKIGNGPVGPIGSPERERAQS
jgi:hypothetical protein